MISTFESKLPNTHTLCMRQAERECAVLEDSFSHSVPSRIGVIVPHVQRPLP